MLGDTPYGPEQRRQFPALVRAVDDDPLVRLVLHAGDVKDGATPCDDAVLADVAALFARFDDPLVLTPGDNEWTDCHRSAGRRYLPLDRLDAVRRTLFAEPGRTLGGRLADVSSQAADPQHGAHVENVRFMRGRVVVASVHVVGSDNGLAPWSGLPGGDR
ncbi:MAG: metallophosphoesterase, partial [Actinomycetota bacterium]|nr:metallophosphoesterase [Actinomycetota bacterium]